MNSSAYMVAQNAVCMYTNLATNVLFARMSKKTGTCVCGEPRFETTGKPKEVFFFFCARTIGANTCSHREKCLSLAWLLALLSVVFS